MSGESSPVREYADQDDTVIAYRSQLDPRVWVAVPHGFADQTWALMPGGLRAVQQWAAEQWGEQGKAQRWVRLDENRWQMIDVELTPKPAQRVVEVAPPGPDDPGYGDWCEEHQEEMQDHTCTAEIEVSR